MSYLPSKHDVWGLGYFTVAFADSFNGLLRCNPPADDFETVFAEIDTDKDMGTCALAFMNVCLLDTYRRVQKKVFFGKGSFQKSPFLEVVENSEILENCHTPENTRASDHFLEILERDCGDSGDSSSEKTPFVMTPFSGPGTIVQNASVERERERHERNKRVVFFTYGSFFSNLLVFLACGKLAWSLFTCG